MPNSIQVHTKLTAVCKCDEIPSPHLRLQPEGHATSAAKDTTSGHGRVGRESPQETAGTALPFSQHRGLLRVKLGPRTATELARPIRESAVFWSD
jgi:hypothetical protein